MNISRIRLFAGLVSLATILIALPASAAKGRQLVEDDQGMEDQVLTRIAPTLL